MNEEELLINISSLQHYVYCPRQCALIHNYNIWNDDWNTAIGTMLHDRVDLHGRIKRSFIDHIYSLRVTSQELHLTGVIDLTEHDLKRNIYYPIEYKKGKPKKHRADEIQLCGYALCLEELSNTEVKEGYIWYYEIKHRIKIIIDDELRKITLETINAVMKLLENSAIPKINYGSQCKGCSLREVCSPNKYCNDWSAEYIRTIYADS